MSSKKIVIVRCEVANKMAMSSAWEAGRAMCQADPDIYPIIVPNDVEVRGLQPVSTLAVWQAIEREFRRPPGLVPSVDRLAVAVMEAIEGVRVIEYPEAQMSEACEAAAQKMHVMTAPTSVGHAREVLVLPKRVAYQWRWENGVACNFKKVTGVFHFKSGNFAILVDANTPGAYATDNGPARHLTPEDATTTLVIEDGKVVFGARPDPALVFMSSEILNGRITREDMDIICPSYGLDDSEAWGGGSGDVPHGADPDAPHTVGN